MFFLNERLWEILMEKYCICKNETYQSWQPLWNRDLHINNLMIITDIIYNQCKSRKNIQTCKLTTFIMFDGSERSSKRISISSSVFAGNLTISSFGRVVPFSINAVFIRVISSNTFSNQAVKLTENVFEKIYCQYVTPISLTKMIFQWRKS